MDTSDVTAYLDEHQLETEIAAAVAQVVDRGASQPLARLATLLAQRAKESALEFDYDALCTDIRELVRSQNCGALFLRLSANDAGTFSAALGGGGPNAAMRFAEGGEAAFEANAGLDVPIGLLAPLKAKYPRISHADLWALAANVAIEAMGGPAIMTRFGRVDADSVAESVEGAAGRLIDADGGEAQLREFYYARGFNDREIVALSGARTVGGCLESGLHLAPAAEFEGHWTDRPHAFDNAYFVDLLERKWAEHSSPAGRPQFKDAGSANLMLLSDLALADDPSLRPWVEAYAGDEGQFFADFAAAWWKLQELGCDGLGLAPHPAALEYASSCWLPTSWLELPLVARREYNHDSTLYTFGLPKGQSLGLPVGACLLVRAPGRGRGGGGKEDWDGSDAVRPYTPTTTDASLGRFELLVKRCDGGAVSQYLHQLALGRTVGFKHTRFGLRAAYPFAGKRRVSMLCTGGCVPPMLQVLRALVAAEGEAAEVVLLCGHQSVEGILLRDELGECVAKAGGRVKLVLVVGSQPDELAPPGWADTEDYSAEAGWIDEAKIEKYCFPPADDTLVLVCARPEAGQPSDAQICGPRSEKELRPGTMLAELGYTESMVIKL